ncbi:hypothetical protein MESS2_1670010 [Mesorhizobium metallidurans STM 2683]|uniref:Uncharacterized protein n=2 Tax=Mesorhizobium TaxID=68287 RepID=A0A1R3V4G9_9HYPH|nr:hypothetical protein MESS2_1670010 [Mesorhizobium metallidurans STM 2683]SIT54813.1 conserved hypothetical protein [Mesorhizobium prunaredense]
MTGMHLWIFGSTCASERPATEALWRADVSGESATICCTRSDIPHAHEPRSLVTFSFTLQGLRENIPLVRLLGGYAALLQLIEQENRAISGDPRELARGDPLPQH